MKRDGNRIGKRALQDRTWFSLLLRAALLSLGSIFFLLGILSLLIWCGWLPRECMEGGVLLCCALGVFCSGLSPSGKTGRGRRLVGIGTAGITLILLVLSGLLLYSSVDGVRLFRQAMACLSGGILAGLLAGTGKKRRRA